MAGEDLVENGVVISTQDGIAKIALIQTDNCEECTAKIFCNPSSDDKKVVEAIDPLGTKPGDQVQILVEGKSILNATILLYLIPLILLVSGIVGSSFIFENTNNKEIYSFLIGFGLMAVYFVFIYLFSPKMDIKSKMPKIINSL